MNTLQEAFFFFLRKGLWGEANSEPCALPALSRGDWEELYRMACSQAVTGLFVDGVAQTALRPDRELWGQWVAHLLQLEYANSRIARCGKWWLEQLHASGLQASVFKGESVARYYRQPSHRCPGDVDIVVESGWERLEPLLRSLGKACRWEQDDLVLEEAGAVLVEFHRTRESVFNPWVNARLQRMLRRERTGKELYAACLILHIRRHALKYGIGLKQVCDVAVMWERAGVDRAKLLQLMRKLHAYRFSCALLGFMAAVLGVSPGDPCPPLRRRDVALLRGIVLGDGYRLRYERIAIDRRQAVAAVRVLRNAWFWAWRGLRLFRVVRSEAVWYLCSRAARRMKSLKQ